MMAPVPMAVLAALAARRPEEPPRVATRAGAFPEFDVRAWLSKHGITIRREKAWIPGAIVLELTACVFNPAHDRGEAAVIRFASGMLLYRCLHTSCTGKTWADLRARFDGPRPARTHQRHRARDTAGAAAGPVPVDGADD